MIRAVCDNDKKVIDTSKEFYRVSIVSVDENGGQSQQGKTYDFGSEDCLVAWLQARKAAGTGLTIKV